MASYCPCANPLVTVDDVLRPLRRENGKIEQYRRNNDDTAACGDTVGERGTGTRVDTRARVQDEADPVLCPGRLEQQASGRIEGDLDVIGALHGRIGLS